MISFLFHMLHLLLYLQQIPSALYFSGDFSHKSLGLFLSNSKMSGMTAEQQVIYEQLIKLEETEWWGTTKIGEVSVEWAETAEEKLKGDCGRFQLPLAFLKAVTEHQVAQTAMNLKKSYKEIVEEQGVVIRDSPEDSEWAYKDVRILSVLPYLRPLASR